MTLLSGSASIVSYPPVEALVLHQFKLLILGLAQEFTATVEITQNDSSVCTKVTSCTSEDARQIVDLSKCVLWLGVYWDHEEGQTYKHC